MCQRLLLASFALLLLPISVFAQADQTGTDYAITGQVADRQEAVGYANVLLMHAADSALAKAEFTDLDGTFTVRADSGTYFMQVVMLGYNDYQSEPFTLTADRDLGDITLAEFAETLETAVVTAKKPFLEQQAGKMIVNVEGSVTGQTGSATQLLRKVPGLIVRQGTVSMAGAAGVTILIDGKPTRYMDVNSLLRDLPASDIQKIEVVSQPGAAYDAEGSGGVINIILKKNVRLGTNGSARLGLGRGTFDKFNSSVRLSHRDGPLNTHGSLSYRRGSGFEQLILDRELDDLRLLQDNFEPYLPNTASIRGGLDYDINDRTTVGISGRFRDTNDDATGINTTRGYADIGFDDPLSAGVQLFDLRTENVNNQDRQSYGADAYYRLKLDTLGRKLEVDASFGAFDRDGFVSTRTDVLSGDLGSEIFDINNNEFGETRVIAGQADYTHPITLREATDDDKGASLSFRSGVKYSYADVIADLKAETRIMGSEQAFQNAPGLTNRFLYEESIAAGYVSVDGKLNEVTFNAGLRYEHTFIDGKNITSDSSFTRDYGNVFPSFGASMPVKGDIGASVAYSYRLNRPSYSSLNPFVRFMDPLTVQRGNTLLQPEFTHNAQFSLTYEGQPFFRLAYSRTTDAIALLTEQDSDTKITEGYSANLDTYTRYGGHLFAPLSFIPKVDGYFGGMAYYNEYQSDFLGSQFDQGSWNFTGFANATVDMPLELKLELNYWIQSGGQEGILQSGTVYGSSIGLERKFLDDQITVGVSYEDGLFDPWDGQIRYQDQRFNIINTWETDIVMLNLTYKFGNRYLKKAERRDSAARDVLNRAD